MNYYIFRHGETYFTKTKTFYGNQVETAEILPEGIPAVKKIAQHLKNIKINKAYTSPYKRNLQTVKIVTDETGIIFKKDKRLGEQMILYGKETFEDFRKRLADFIEHTKSEGFQNIAVCSHGWPIAGLVAIITKGGVQKEDLENYPEPGELIIIKNTSIEVVDYNKMEI